MPQRRAQSALQFGELALGDADLVAAPGRGHVLGRVLGRLAEGHQARGDAAHRPHHEPLQAEENQRRGHQRQNDRKDQDATRVIEHLGAHRRLVERDIDEDLGIDARRPDDAQHPVARLAEGDERLANEFIGCLVAQIERGVDRGRLAEHQIGGGRHAQRDRAHPRMRQELLLQLGRDHAVGRRLEGQRRLVRRRQTLLEIDQAIARHRGHVDQHLAEHHEGDGKHQEPGGKALGKRRHGEPFGPLHALTIKQNLFAGPRAAPGPPFPNRRVSRTGRGGAPANASAR